MTSSRRSSSSTYNRTSFPVPRKSTQSPSISVVYAEPQQSSPPPGSAAARLTPRLSIQNLQERKRATENGSIAVDKLRSDSTSETRSLSGNRLRSGTVSSLDIPRSKSWFSFRRSPSKQSLRDAALSGASVPGSETLTSNHTPDTQTLEVQKPTDPIGVTDSDTITSDSRRSSSTLSLKKRGNSSNGLSGSPTERRHEEIYSIPISESPTGMSVHDPGDKTVEIETNVSVPDTKVHVHEKSKENSISAQGWFGSFSGRNRNEKNIVVPQNESECIDDVDTSNSKQVSSQSLWFTPRDSTQAHPEEESFPSPLDVTTPVQSVPSVSETIIREIELISAHKSETLLSTMNPSMSRFLLSVPLLGRPKTTVEVSSGTSEMNKETIQETAGASVNETPDSSTVVQSDPNREVKASDLSVTIVTPLIGDPLQVNEHPVVSWWSLVGLGSKPIETFTPEPSTSVSPTPNEEQLSDGACDITESSSHQERADNQTIHAEEVSTNEVKDTPAFFSNASVQAVASHSTWLSPYGWYEWYSTGNAISTGNVPNSDSLRAKEGDASSNVAESSSPEPLLSNKDTGASTSTAPTSSEAVLSDINLSSTLGEPANPITVSFAMNPRSWASFFSSSSKLLTTKLVTEKEEKTADAMEVMTIDEACDNSSALPLPLQVDSSLLNAGSVATSSSSSPSIKLNGNPSVNDIGVSSGLAEDTENSEKSSERPATPLTVNENVKRKVLEAPVKRGVSPTPSRTSSKPASPTPRPPNLVLPTFNDTFRTLPRKQPRPIASQTSVQGPGVTLKKTINFVSNVLFSRDLEASPRKKMEGTQNIEKIMSEFGKDLPRAWDIGCDSADTGHLSQAVQNIVIIGIHGWFPGYAMRTVIGEPTGTSAKFANMMELAVKEYAEKHGINYNRITKIPLEGEGKIKHRVDKLYNILIGNNSWVESLRDADAIFVATHSQGSIVSTHLIGRLIKDGYITAVDSKDEVIISSGASIASGSGVGMNSTGVRRQRVCCLALCGIHLGPLAYLQKSSFVMPYIQFFESEAAAELFEFQHTESQVSQEYVEALKYVLDHRVKFVYIASLNDQVVPVYSGAFTSVYHPLILRALYIDGDAYNSSDFLSNLLVLLFRIRNAGLSDGGLLAHLSEATAGSLNGVGHSTAYEELASFSLAVDYLFLTDDGSEETQEFNFEPFNARVTLNDYEIPWSLRDLIADERVVYLFSNEFSELRDAFNDWHPRTTILRDLKRKLEPIRRLKLASRL